MKYLHFYFIFIPFLFSCNHSTMENRKGEFKLEFESFPLEVPEQHSLMAKWENKQVLDKKLIDDMEQDKGWVVDGIGQMSYTNERAHDGERAMRFRTSLRDEQHYRDNRSAWDSFNGSQGGRTFVQLSFDEPQDWTDYNRLSFWIYVHPTSMPTYSIYLSLNCEGAKHNATTPGHSHHVHDLKPGQWNNVLFEIPHLQRDRITYFRINQMLRGHNPEEEGIVTYDIDQLEIHRINPDKYEGWEVANNKIAYNHLGYRNGDRKIALAGKGSGDSFELVDPDNEVVFSGKVGKIKNEQGTFRVLDFSEFITDGEYRLKSGSIETKPFPINEKIWEVPLFKALNFYFCERCGYSVPGVHLACHKDWQGFYGDTKKVINGGWHDAGDLSQGFWRTAMGTWAMMLHLQRLENYPELNELSERIRTELAWGMEWLLKTRFGDGYHMSFSVMRIYTDNEIGTIDDVVTPARNVPWENFLAAAVQAKASTMMAETHPGLAKSSYIAAVDDYQAAMASRDTWDQADYREASWGATSSIIMGNITGKKKYFEQAVDFGKLLVKCQEQKFLDGIPIAGYFYTGSDRQQVIHNRHAAFEEAPLIALSNLCEQFPDHENWIDWYSTAAFHSEFFMKRGSHIAAPYNHLPNSVWKYSEIMQEEDDQTRQDMIRQFNDGTPLSDGYVLRTFPVYYDGLFHGSTNIQLSSAWALAQASRLRKDAAGMDLVKQQLDWVLGANPFGQSLMYGVGYDFAPHFAYCLKNIVGSLPVGMDCMSGDDPYWSASNTATHKEIWIEPVNRFLGTLSVYTSSNFDRLADKTDESLDLLVIPESKKGNRVSYLLTTGGKGNHELKVRTYNVRATQETLKLELTGKEEQIPLEFVVIDPSKPYVVVFIDDIDPDKRWEIVDSLSSPDI